MTGFDLTGAFKGFAIMCGLAVLAAGACGFTAGRACDRMPTINVEWKE